MENENYPKPCISLLWNPRGVFIGIRGTGGQGTNPGPKRRAPRPYGRGNAAWPAFRGPLVAARAALRAARDPFGPLLDSAPDFWFLAPGFDESALLGQWLS